MRCLAGAARGGHVCPERAAGCLQPTSAGVSGSRLGSLISPGGPAEARSLAKRLGLSKDTIAKVWTDHNLKPWKVATFKVSNDPHFEDKLVDVVGLYLNPPKRAVVFSFDEKTQCQAVERTSRACRWSRAEPAR